jgi:hypothetical protein
LLALPFPLAVHPECHLQFEPWTLSVKILYKTTHRSKILHQTTLKLQFSHDESDTDFPTQNDTTDENPTQNDEISTETRTEQQISDIETTCADYIQETQLLSGTQPNLAISPQNSPKTGSSHTETPSNSSPTAKFASGPLQRFSEAVSNILTPKTEKNYLRFRPRRTRTPNLRLRPIFPRRPKFHQRKIPHPGIRTHNHRICHKNFRNTITKTMNFFTCHLQNQPNLRQNHPILKLTPKTNQKLKNPFQHAKLRAR